MWSNHSSLRSLPRKRESTQPGRDFHPNALSNMDWKRKRLEASHVSIDWWMDKQTMGYSCNKIPSEMKRNELSIHTTTQMELKIIMLSERRQANRTHTVCFHFYNCRKCKWACGDRKQIWLPRDWGRGAGARDFKGGRHKETLGDDGYAHYLEHTYVKTHRMVHFKYVQFIVCQLSFNEVKGKGICEEVQEP